MKLRREWTFGRIDNVTFYFRRDSTAGKREQFFTSPVTHTTGGIFWAYLDNDCPGAPLLSIREAHEWLVANGVDSPWEN
jgi:hypothetical protein